MQPIEHRLRVVDRTQGPGQGLQARISVRPDLVAHRAGFGICPIANRRIFYSAAP
ncbi:hypothetical protein [Embleya sp. NPDC005575]|uniref:hypothetical protein n=1 Tax=Embleya sp. NPDC005575 TaxID=3156892 RepID=UPI0033BC01CF